MLGGVNGFRDGFHRFSQIYQKVARVGRPESQGPCLVRPGLGLVCPGLPGPARARLGLPGPLVGLEHKNLEGPAAPVGVYPRAGV